MAHKKPHSNRLPLAAMLARIVPFMHHARLLAVTGTILETLTKQGMGSAYEAGQAETLQGLFTVCARCVYHLAVDTLLQ